MLVKNATDSGWTVIAVMGGFALVNNNKVTILVNEAELGSVRFAYIIQLFYLIFLRLTFFNNTITFFSLRP